MEPFPLRKIILAIVLVATAFLGYILWRGTTGYNHLQNYVVWQGVSGKVRCIDQPGYYGEWFGNSWEYPKTVQVYWSANDGEGHEEKDESIRVTFNDAGSAKISAMVQFNMPLEPERRLRLHERFGGNLDNIKHAVHAHLTNCIKNTGPLMSASENQSSRKSEFTQAVEEQLRNGLYQMRRTRITLTDRVDDKGQPIQVDATEVITDKDGVAQRTERSPLEEYGITITQFSITGTDYDDRSNAQFAAKQEAFLAAEKSKAQREEEIQRKLMVVAKGEREKAEIESEANKVKAKAVTEEQQKVEVAEKTKQTAQTLANQQLEVAKIAKQQAETEAEKAKAVAKLKAEQEAEVLKIESDAKLVAAQKLADAEKARATGIVALAEAEQKLIQLGGSVKESDKVLASIAADRDVKVAEALARISVPATIIQGGGTGGQGGGNDFTQFLLNVTFLKNLGIIKDAPTIAPTGK